MPVVNTNTKTEIVAAAAAALSTDVATLQNNVNNWIGSHINEVNEWLMNAVFLQEILDTFSWLSPLVSNLMQMTSQIGDIAEISEPRTGLTKYSNYDRAKYIPTEVQKNPILQVRISTVVKKVFLAEIELAYLQGAFQNDGTVAALASRVMKKFKDDIELYIHYLITGDMGTSIKNVLDLSATTGTEFKDKIQAAVVKIYEFVRKLKQPTVMGNCGFTQTALKEVQDEYDTWKLNPDAGPYTPTKDLAYKTNITTSQPEDLMWLSSAKTLNYIDKVIQPVLFHADKFNLSEFGMIVELDIPDDEVWIISKDMYRIFWRHDFMLPTLWAKNAVNSYDWHLSIRYGLIPWCNGFKVKLPKETAPVPSGSDSQDSGVEEVNIGLNNKGESDFDKAQKERLIVQKKAKQADKKEDVPSTEGEA